MVMDKNFLEIEDLYILDQMKQFLQNEEVSKIPAARRLLQVALVERAVSPASFVWSKLSDSGAIAWRRY